MSDAQDRAEATDIDKTDGDYPPEEPMGVDEDEVTADGEWAQESFEERTARIDAAGTGADEPVVHPYVDPAQDVLDDEAQAVADESPPSSDRGEMAGQDVPEPAEEAALHIEGP